MKRIIGLALVLAIGLAPSAFAQVSTGNIYGKVTDESGAVLPGATVAMTGASGGRSTTAGAGGEFRFIGLDTGDYELAVALSGFSTLTRKVILVTNQNVDLDFTMRVATIEETVLVTAETPVVDAKKLGTNTTLTRDELQRIPQARDPWAVLRTIPGVIVDRVNIAGNESGQQASFQAKGASDDDITWNLDGVQIDDMAAAGASPTYYDYDAFEEIAVNTGGNSLNVQTGSVGINFVTKRGTNRWRGSARGLITHDDMQWSNVAGTQLEGDPRLQGNDKADHIQQVSDYGVELGGPLVKDKLHIWGSWGKQDIRLLRTDQTADKTNLSSFNGKLNWQITPSTSASVFFFNGKKVKNGRSPGLGLQWADSGLWDQDNLYSDFMPGNIHGLLKFEINHIFSPDFFMNVKYSNYDNGFTLASRAPESVGTLDFNNGVGRGNWLDFGSARPLKNITDLSGSYFASGWGGNHEVKFGFGYKQADVSTTTVYGGTDERIVAWDFGPGASYAWVSRDAVTSLTSEFFYGYLGDTFTKGRLTISAGLRFDYQNSENLGASIAANPGFPDLLPAIEFDGGGEGVTWTDVSPRLGITYALDDARKTVVRASFAQYVSKLNTTATFFDNPLQGAYQAYIWNDTNGDGLPTASEVDLASGIQYFGGHDPADPGAIVSPNRIDPDYRAPKDLEVVIGLDRELIPDLAVTAAYTWRRNSDIRDWNTRIGLTSADYTANAPVTANGFTAQTFSPDAGLVAANGGGQFKTNRPDFHQTFNGFEVSLIKRLSNKWMGRAAFSYASLTETLEGPDATQNPTRSDVSGALLGGTNALAFSGPQVDGGQVVNRSSGSGKGDIFFNAKWQFSANLLYELPKNFEVSGSIYGRQGFPRPIVLNLGAGQDGAVRTLATAEIDDNRYPNLFNFDLRLANNVRLGGDRSLTIAAELFNVLNSNTELNRQRQAQAGAFGRLDEILSPRILRIGARLSF